MSWSTANWGGILGLCCGISALSFVELFYHVSLRLWNSAARKLKTPLHIDMKHDQTKEGTVLEMNIIPLQNVDKYQPENENTITQ